MAAFVGGELHQPAAPRAAFLDFVFEHLSAKTAAAFGASGSHAFDLAPLHSGARQPGDERQL